GMIAIDASNPADWPALASSGHFGHVGTHLALLCGASSDGPASVEDAVFHTRLDLSEARRLQRIARADGHASLLVEGEGGTWLSSSEARIAPGPANIEAEPFAEPQDEMDVAEFYASLASLGLELGPELRSIESLALGGGNAMALLRAATSGERLVYDVPASAYEAIAQVAAALFTDEATTRIVAGWDRLQRSAAPAVAPFTIRASATGPYSADATLLGADGVVLVGIEGLTLAPLSAAQRKPWTGRVAWVPSPIEQAAPGALGVTGIGVRAAGIVRRVRDAFSDAPDAPSAIVFAPHVEEEPAALAETVARVLRLPRGARLILATSGTAAPRPGLHLCAEAGAGIWGIARTLAHERADLDLRVVDLDPSDDPVAALSAEIRAAAGALATAWRAGVRYVERLVPMATEVPTRPSALAIDGAGALAMTAAERVAPSNGEIEIAVSVAAANFRDVMVTKGLLPPTRGLGAECAGVVAAKGAGVDGFAVGDIVVAYVPDGDGAIRTHLTVPTRLVRRLPPGLAPIRAGSCLLSVMIARRALIDIGALRAGEVVFVHQAASGMGLAAIALARRLGATVIASAHPDKHAFLHSLGVTEIVNSRETFTEAVRGLSGRGGVDLAI
ncbi:MAG TPA: polyketide synthase dehydratase domain-containing protein, partial [Saliniramus sp.]|nr:polyketide synthase dehydratase domain-containing protein [Saliniramus sp.]